VRIHDIGPRSEAAFPAAKPSPWSQDYGRSGVVELDRPFIDDHPASRHGWAAPSRWGSRPVRNVDAGIERRGTAMRRFMHLAWTWVQNVVSDGG
jgi:hypothetical protein